MKRIVSIALCLVLLLSSVSVIAEGDCDVSGHDFAEASCTAPKTCKVCGKEEGEPLGHDWEAADCDLPKRCKNCFKTVGERLTHKVGYTACGEKPKCIYCGKIMGYTQQHYYENEWEDTCTRCGYVRDVDYDYVIEVGEELVIKQGGERPFNYRVSDSSILEKIVVNDCSGPELNDTGYEYCTKGTFVGRKAGKVQVIASFGAMGGGSWYVKVVESDKSTTAKPTTKKTTKTTAKSTTETIEKPTESTTEATESTTESTTVPTTQPTTVLTTTPTTEVAGAKDPKGPNVWPFVGGGALLIVGVAVAILLIRKKK